MFKNHSHVLECTTNKSTHLFRLHAVYQLFIASSFGKKWTLEAKTVNKYLIL